MLDTAPGQADKEAGHTTHENEDSDPVRLSQLLRERELRDSIEPDIKHGYNEPDRAEGVVYVKAPSPRGVLCDDAT